MNQLYATYAGCIKVMRGEQCVQNLSLNEAAHLLSSLLDAVHQYEDWRRNHDLMTAKAGVESHFGVSREETP